ncbi:hypothetical protein M0R36_10960 [bacterium]|jgi:hypothetical protein|nr:hypothetical protein [bacterium]
MGYTKLFSSIIHSTIWREPDHVRIVWVTMLAMTDQYGVVECSVPGLADAARVNLQQCIEAIDRLSAPDPYSRCPDYDGRRIEKVDGGFQILNYEYYRRKASEEEKREKNADKQRRWRERQKALQSVTEITDSNKSLPSITDRNQALQPVTENNPSEQIRTDQNIPDQIKDKKNKKRASSPVVNEEDKKLALTFLKIFNQVFDRDCGDLKGTTKSIRHRMTADDYAEWQILISPIMECARDPGVADLKNFGPTMLLRDGRHPRTGRDGHTTGAVDWLERLYSVADTVRLDERLTAIAEHFGLLDDIKRTGAKVYQRMETADEMAF